MKNYITPQGEEVIKEFKYKGGSISYSYLYLWSPLAEFFVSYLPLTIAANTITLLGFFLNVIGCLSIAIQTPLSEPVYPSSLIFFSICVFTYQTLDNMDGKQARRTRKSSPLGMLLDHGCDACGIMFLALGVGRIICVSDQRLYLICSFFGVMFGFYTSVWCQYYSKGILYLSKVNAVDDGIPIVWLLGIISFLFGQNFWQYPLYITSSGFVLNLQVCLILFVMCSVPIQIWGLIYTAGENFTNNYLIAFSDLLHFVLISLSLLLITEISTIHTRHFYVIFFTLGTMFVRNITYMQVCVVAKMKYYQFQFSTVLFIIAYPIYIYLLENYISEKLFVYALLFVIVFQYFYFVLSVLRQIRRILNIRVFRIKKDKPF